MPDIADLEAPLLNTEFTNTTSWVKSIAGRPKTAVGLVNFCRVFRTSNATESLDAAFSVGTPAPGQSRGNGNLLFGAY